MLGRNSKIIDGNTYMTGGFIGRIPGTFFLNAPIGTVNRQPTFVACKIITTYVTCYRTYTPNEIIQKLYQMGTHSSDRPVAYGLGEDIYYPVYKSDNSPNNELIEGENIEPQLRPWQLGNITENTFTWEDIPQYVPDLEDGSDSGGDDIRSTDFNTIVIGAGNNFTTLYGLSELGVSQMGQKLWASLSDMDFWETVGTVWKNDASINPADMMKYFVSLRYYPLDLGGLQFPYLSVASDGIFIGRATAPLLIASGVRRLTRNIINVDGGSLTISRYFNDFRDYEPCTQVQVSIPFCGNVDLPASEVMGHTLYLTYKLDLQTGALLAVIDVASDTYYTIATIGGTCGASIPITANNNIEFLQRIATVGQAAFSGGVSGALNGAKAGADLAPITATAGAIGGSVTSGVGALAGLPPVTVHKQGYASGFANLGGVNRAYATITRQRYEVPNNYGHTTGYATDFEDKIANLSGLTVCINVDTTGIPCNESEREEIKRLLEGGIYV